MTKQDIQTTITGIGNEQTSRAITATRLASLLGDMLDYSESALVKNVTGTSVSLLPNVLYVWGDITTLTVIFNAGDEHNVGIKEYMMQFSTGSTAADITFPDGVIWLDGEEPEWEPNSVYQVSIVNNLAVYAGWEKEEDEEEEFL